MEPVSRRAAMLGALGVAGASLVGCTSTPAETSAAPAPSQTPTPTPTTEATPRWPLNGKVLKNPEKAAHIAVAVKVPDSEGEHPQLGLDKADIVYVELDGYPAQVGVSGTRLVPIFHSEFPEAVNPVRSIRPVDIPMLSPINPVIGNTGAFKWVMDYAKEFSDYLVPTKTYMAMKGTGAYSILQSRVRTLNGVTYYDRAVTCHPAVLAEQTKKFATGPQVSYFPWAESEDEVSTMVSGETATSITVPWKKEQTYPMRYTWSEKKGRYLRSMPWGKHVLADGTRVSCDNVLVIKAKQTFGKIYRSGTIKPHYGGHDEPIHEIINAEGTFYYAFGGKFVKGTWKKGEVNEVFQFTLDDGTPLKMSPGQTYVELPNTTSKIAIKS